MEVTGDDVDKSAKMRQFQKSFEIKKMLEDTFHRFPKSRKNFPEKRLKLENFKRIDYNIRREEAIPVGFWCAGLSSKPKPCLFRLSQG